MKIKHLNLPLTEEEHRLIKTRSAMAGLSMKEFLIKLVREHAEKGKK